ncbi:uncharacterized protein LOC127868332 [Dreissena polymorpha]|uniref:Ras-associating domain-containing protein n=1 Tax=Dreissena polymorpha TaxID=45954 RepID=A0A9D4M6K8_DREPO|nr:uncharacterized protein LOC127868332 [Dreissena polymorpha]KAH3870739.1 hypothetical protein DPMN_033929 [Dreissena polymorpha]
MVDVQHMKDKGIPLRIDGSTRYVKGATKYTTCADVIKMVLKKTGIGKEYRHLFCIFENSLTGEKLVPRNERMLKLVQSWNGGPNKLVMRRVEPLATVENPEIASKPKTKTLFSKNKTEHVVKAGKKEDPYMRTLISLAYFVEKQKAKLGEPATERCESSSESDSSMEDFLSNLDRTKMAGLVHFFAAMAGAKKKSCTKLAPRKSSESDESGEPMVSLPKRRNSKRRSKNHLRSKRQHKRHKNAPTEITGDIHPNKMHRIDRVNFGFIDVEPCSRDLLYSRSNRNLHRFSPHTKEHTSRTFTARRRLLPSISATYDMSKNRRQSASSFLPFSDDECMSDGKFTQITHRASASSESSASTFEVDCTYLVPNSQFYVMDRRHSHVLVPRTTCIDDLHRVHTVSGENFGPIHKKLVDYTITDDEMSDIDSDIGSAGSKCSFSSVSSEGSCGNLCQQSAVHKNQYNDCAFIQTEIGDNDVSDYIRNVFSKKCAIINEDEEMDSFMKSVLGDDSVSDEGHCSMGSDFERDMRV